MKRAPHDGRRHLYHERFNVGRAAKCIRCHGTPSALWVCKECEENARLEFNIGEFDVASVARYCRPCVPADAAVRP